MAPKSPTIGGKQHYSVTLTKRFKLHKSSEPGPSQLESPPLSPVSVSEHYKTEPLLSDVPSSPASRDAQSETLVTNIPDETGESGSGGRGASNLSAIALRAWRRGKKPYMRGFYLDSDSYVETSSGEESYFPETPEDSTSLQIRGSWMSPDSSPECR